LKQLVSLKQEQKEFDAAGTLARDEVDTCKVLYGGRHSEVARSLRDLASSLLGKGDARSAETHAREALAMNRALHEPPDADTLESLMVLGTVLFFGAKNYKEAIPIMKEAVSLSRQVYGNEHPRVGVALRMQEALYVDQNDFVAALPVVREQLKLNRRLYTNEHPRVATSLNSIGMSYFYLNDFRSAEEAWNEALALRRKLLGAEHPQVTWIISNLGLLKYEQKDYAAAEALFRESLRIQRKTMPARDAQIGFALVGLGRTVLARGRAIEAEKLAREGVTILRASDERNSWAGADAESVWGGCLLALHRYTEAEPVLVQSFPRIKDGEGGLHKRTDEARQRLIRLYQGLHQPDQVERYRQD
jgi:tetratricopeptide (TPR) repeat protein